MSDDPFGDALAERAAAAPPSESGDPFGDALSARAVSTVPATKPGDTKPADRTWYENLGTHAGHAAMDLAGGVAHAAGNLVDVATNTYPGAGSHAEKFSRPFQHEADEDPVDRINAEQLARAGKKPFEFSDALPEGPLKEELRVRVPQAAEAIGTVAPAGKGLAGRFRTAAEVGDAQAIADRAGSQQSMGAASAATNLADAHPTIKQAIVDAARRTGGAVNRDAMDAHIEASRNGVDLMKGQATRDPVQFSEEQNNSTHPRISARINQQNQQMTDRLDEIRRDTAPAHVHNDVIQNGQTVVDRLKAYDEPVKADIKAKYQALTDAAGGHVPIDEGQFLTNVDAGLKKGFLTKTAANSPEISEIIDTMRSGQGMDFEAFEHARSRLAEVQRSGGSAAAAAKIVRNELEQLPLSPEASKLKGLADSARSAAKARFDALDRDPAYRSAVEETESGIKRGEPSPLADRFLDKYALGSAPKANVDVMLQKLDDESKGAIASHTLNQVRTAAIGRNGTVLPAGYSGAMQKLSPKIESLLPQDTIDDLQSLGRVVHNAKVAPEGHSVNYSKSGVVVNAANAAKGAAEHVLDAKTGGLYGLGKRILRPDQAAHEKWVNETLKPGAGIDSLNSK